MDSSEGTAVAGHELEEWTPPHKKLALQHSGGARTGEFSLDHPSFQPPFMTGIDTSCIIAMVVNRVSS